MVSFYVTFAHACVYALSIPVPSGLVYAARHGFLLHVGAWFHELPTYVDAASMQVEKRDGMLRFTFTVTDCEYIDYSI